MSKRNVPGIVAAILLLVLPHTAFSWGNEGHQAVARIAARQLTPAAQQKIVALLRSDMNDDLRLKAIIGESGKPKRGALEKALATMATWPDSMPKPGKGPTSPWHFVDIGLFEGPSNIDGRCPDGACVSRKIDELLENLKTGKSIEIAFKPPRTYDPPVELRFLVHFLGDIHQPLHCATNGDAGGNCLKEKGYRLKFPEVHAVWDTALVQEAIKKTPGNFAGSLINEFDGKLNVPEATTNQIAAESFEIATHVYKVATPQVPIIDHFVEVTPGTCEKQAPPEINAITVDARASYDNAANLLIVRQQLYKGGVRLGKILNAIYDHP